MKKPFYILLIFPFLFGYISSGIASTGSSDNMSNHQITSKKPLHIITVSTDDVDLQIKAFQFLKNASIGTVFGYKCADAKVPHKLCPKGSYKLISRAKDKTGGYLFNLEPVST